MEISVVIPLFNKRNYISRAIDSVLNQTENINEIIIIDDGSTDGGGQLVSSLDDSRVKLFTQTNTGECAARNRGILEASFSLIGFLDADDEWKPEFLTQIRNLMNNFPDCGAYATSAQIIEPDGKIVYPNISILPSEPWIGIIPNFFELFQAGYAFNASSVVVPKKVFDDVGCFPEGITISGDVACWVNIALRYPIAFSPTRSVIYHQEAENRVGTQFKPLKELPYIQTIRKGIETGTIPVELRSSAFEFMSQKQIMVATENIMAGDPVYARHLLSSCKRTKKYRRAWLWWRLWASLPVGWPKTMLNLKQKLTKRTRSTVEKPVFWGQN